MRRAPPRGATPRDLHPTFESLEFERESRELPTRAASRLLKGASGLREICLGEQRAENRLRRSAGHVRVDSWPCTRSWVPQRSLAPHRPRANPPMPQSKNRVLGLKVCERKTGTSRTRHSRCIWQELLVPATAGKGMGRGHTLEQAALLRWWALSVLLFKGSANRDRGAAARGRFGGATVPRVCSRACPALPWLSMDNSAPSVHILPWTGTSRVRQRWAQLSCPDQWQIPMDLSVVKRALEWTWKHLEENLLTKIHSRMTPG